MSAFEGSFQTQISSVLEALVKVAEVELTKLFQKHCLASLTNVNIEGLSPDHHSLVNFKRPEKCRSIGVQVDEGTAAWELPMSGGDCLKEGTDGEAIPLVEASVPADSEVSVLKEKDEDVGVSSRTSRNPGTTCREPKTCDPACDVHHPPGAVPSLSAKQGHRSRQTKLQNRSEAHRGLAQHAGAARKAEKRPPTPQPPTPQPPTSQPPTPQAPTPQAPTPQPPTPQAPTPQPPTPQPPTPQAPTPQPPTPQAPTLQLWRVEEPGRPEPQQASVSAVDANKGPAFSLSPADCAVASLRVSLWDRLASVKGALDERQKQVSQDKKLQCPCSVQLVNLSLVESGRNKADGGGGGGDKPKAGGFQTPRDLRAHQGLHTGRRLCCFTRCGNGVWRLQGVLPGHHRHAHCCETCGKRFKRRKVLRRHERFHTGEKPYRCPKCRKAFALRKSLRRHQRFHTGERPYGCSQCGKSFRLRENLKAHLRFHTGEKPFACPVCAKSFRIFRNLEKHNISHF